MEKITAFFRVIYLAFFSAPFYRDVYCNLKGTKLGYLSVVIGFVSILTAVSSSYIIWHSLVNKFTNEQIDYIVSQAPPMMIVKGELQLPNNKTEGPITLVDKDGNPVVIIDSQAHDNKYQSENVYLVATKTGVFVMGENQVRFDSVIQEESLNIDKPMLLGAWVHLLSVLKIVLPIFGFIATFFYLFVKTIFYAIVFAWTSILVSKTGERERLKFEPLFRLGIFASFPCLMLYILQPLSPIDVGWFGLGYLVFAYYSVLYKPKAAK